MIAWFHTLILAKILRALEGLAGDVPEERHWPADHDGSATVALIGIERSHAAWLALPAGGLASSEQVQPLVADLVWLGDALERVFPHARRSCGPRSTSRRRWRGCAPRRRPLRRTHRGVR